MSRKHATREELTETITEMLKQAYPPKDIRRIMYDQYTLSYSETNAILLELGVQITPSMSDSRPTNYSKYKRMPQGQQFGNSAMVGLVIMIIGIVVTIGTYSAASNNPDGGRYVIAWGAILFGGIQFLRGLME